VEAASPLSEEASEEAEDAVDFANLMRAENGVDNPDANGVDDAAYSCRKRGRRCRRCVQRTGWTMPPMRADNGVDDAADASRERGRRRQCGGLC
jgi:hypothetical protein